MKANKKLTVQDMFEIVWREHWSTERFKKSGHARQVEYNYENHIRKSFAELLNHKSVQTTKIYAKLYDTARVHAVTAIAGKMDEILGVKVDESA